MVGPGAALPPFASPGITLGLTRVSGRPPGGGHRTVLGWLASMTHRKAEAMNDSTRRSPRAVPDRDRQRPVTTATARRWRTRSLAVAAAVALAGPALAGCAIVHAAHKLVQTVDGNRNTIDQFTANMKSSEATPFEATYVTTGSSPAIIVYAVEPPKDLVFTDTPSGGGSAGVGKLDIIMNSSGEYLCTPGSSGSAATCEKLPAARAAVQNKILDFYTPSHWVAFLHGFALAAGFAGDKVSASSLTVNGFRMSCVDLVASGVAGTSQVCTTTQGILGYVKVASESTSFRIRSYSTSPSASLFQLPPGAKIKNVQTGGSHSGGS
jgi:hypothetical protein